MISCCFKLLQECPKDCHFGFCRCQTIISLNLKTASIVDTTQRIPATHPMKKANFPSTILSSSSCIFLNFTNLYTRTPPIVAAVTYIVLEEECEIKNDQQSNPIRKNKVRRTIIPEMLEEVLIPYFFHISFGFIIMFPFCLRLVSTAVP